jgi:hypothetical protein
MGVGRGGRFFAAMFTERSGMLIAEGDAHRAAGLDHLAFGRHEFEPVDGVGNRNAKHLIVLIADHLAKLLFGDEFDGADAETGAENSVQSGRGSAALQVSKDAGARFLFRAGRYLASDDFANAPQAIFSNGHRANLLVAFFGASPLRSHDHRAETVVGVSFADGLGDFFVIERDFRNEDDVRAAGEPAVERDPSGVPPHDLDDHGPLVTAGGGVQAVESIRHAGHGAVEAESHGRGFEVVVDRLWDADDGNSLLVQLESGAERTIAADGDESVDAEFPQRVARLIDDFGWNASAGAFADLGDKMAAIGGSEDGAAELHDACSAADIEDLRVVRSEKSLVSVVKTNHFPVAIGGGADDAAKHRVEPGAISTAGKNAYTCFHN